MAVVEQKLLSVVVFDGQHGQKCLDGENLHYKTLSVSSSALLSVFPPDVQPAAETFPLRHHSITELQLSQSLLQLFGFRSGVCRPVRFREQRFFI